MSQYQRTIDSIYASRSNKVYDRAGRETGITLLCILFGLAIVFGGVILMERYDKKHPVGTTLPANCAQVVVAHHNYTTEMWTGKSYMIIVHSDPITRVICANLEPDIND